VQVIPLHRKLEDAEPVARPSRNALADDPVDAWCPQRSDPRPGPHRQMHRVTPLVSRTRAMGRRRPQPPPLAPSSLAGPSPCRGERQGELARARAHLKGLIYHSQ
jgi:hypothetical protein